MKRLLLALCLLAAVAAPARAQSTPVGRHVFSAVDVWWEKLQERNPWLYQLDNTDEKTWVLHGLITQGCGFVLGRVTPMSFRRGRQTCAAFYVSRELYGVLFEGNRDYKDAVGDALVPVAVALIRVQVRIRL